MKFREKILIGSNDPAIGRCVNCQAEMTGIWYIYCRECDNNPKLHIENEAYCLERITKYLKANKLTDDPAELIISNRYDLNHPLTQEHRKILVDNN